MLDLKNQLNCTLEKLKSKSEGFIYGNLFPVILCLFALAFFIADLSMIGFGGLILIGCFILIIYDDMTPTIPILFIIPMTMRDTSILWYEIYPYFIILPAGIALIINFIRFPFKSPKFDKLCWCFVAIILTSITGGLFTSTFADFYKGIGFLLLSGVLPLVMHFVYDNKTKTPSKINLANYLCYSFVLSTCLACIQLVYALIYNEFIPSTFPLPGGFCWANSNHIANLIIIAIPLLCYLMLRLKNIIPALITLVFLYVCLFFTKSEACFFIALGFTPLIMYNLIKHSPKNNLKLIFSFISICIFAFILVVTFYALFKREDLIKFLNNATSDSGRQKIYLFGLELFIKNPIFGSGIGYAINNELAFYSGYFHSTIVQVLATTGIIGFIPYVFLYIHRIKKINKNRTILGSYALISFIMYSMYAIIDNGDFNVVLIYITLIITIIDIANEKGNDFSLPLTSINSTTKLSNQFCK